MSTAVAYPHIEKLPGEPARLSRVPRVRVAMIAMDYLAYGWSPDEMCRPHSYLTLAEAHSTMAYYFDHQSEVDDEIREEVRLIDAGAPRSPFQARMRAKANGLNL